MDDLGKSFAVLLDLDGTLVDSAPGIASALQAIKRTPGEVARSEVRSLVSSGVESLVRVTLGVAGPALAHSIQEFRSVYASAPCEPSDIFPGALSALSFLADRGIQIGICTNKPQHLAELVVDRVGIRRLIDVVVGTHPNTVPKPAPDMLLRALKLTGRSEALLFVGDSHIDAAASNAAGIPFAFASFGYGPEPADTVLYHDLPTLSDLPALASRLLRQHARARSRTQG